jgi:hypothetical protein
MAQSFAEKVVQANPADISPLRVIVITANSHSGLE